MVSVQDQTPATKWHEGAKTDLLLLQANLPNLRRLFVEARTEVEENEYSRTAVWVSMPDITALHNL